MRWGAACAAIGVLLACPAGCGSDRTTPTEPPPSSPTPTPRPTVPATPTPLPGQSDFAFMETSFPLVMHRGEEIVFSASMTGKPGIAGWEHGGLTFGFVDGFVDHVALLEFEGDTFGRSGSTANGGFDFVLKGGRFEEGTRRSFRALIAVKPDARLGYTLIGYEAYVSNGLSGEQGLFQQVRFYAEIVP